MLIESILSSIIIGKIRGGKIVKIGKIHIKGWYLFVIAFLIQAISTLSYKKDFRTISVIVEEYFVYINIGAYILMIIGILLNINQVSMRYIFIGTLLNCVAVFLNGGKMPVFSKCLKYVSLDNHIKVLEEGKILTHTLMSNETKFKLFADVIPIPKPYPFPKVISVGDILISIGIFLLIQRAMMMREKRNGTISSFYIPN